MTVQFATMYKPVRIIIYQMNEANQVLKQTAYKPSEVPDSLSRSRHCLYSDGNQKGRYFRRNGDNQDNLEFEFVRG